MSRFGAGALSWLCCIAAIAASAAQQPNLDKAVKQLQSRNWEQREAAFTRLERDSTVWRSPAMRGALAQLLRRENQFTNSVVSASHMGVSDMFGEGYAEYTNEVFGTCIEYCSRAALLAVMLDEARTSSPGRGLAVEMLSLYRMKLFSPLQRRSIDSAFVAASADPTSYMVRVPALGALAEIVRSDPELSPGDRALIHFAAVAATSDNLPRIRALAIQLLTEFGGASDRPLLMRIAAEDTDRVTYMGPVTYPVRDAARRALETLSRKQP